MNLTGDENYVALPELIESTLKTTVHFGNQLN